MNYGDIAIPKKTVIVALTIFPVNSAMDLSKVQKWLSNT